MTGTLRASLDRRSFICNECVALCAQVNADTAGSATAAQ